MRVGHVDQNNTDHIQKSPGQRQDVEAPQQKEKGTSGSGNGKGKESVSTGEVLRSIEKANESMMLRHTELHFSVHEKTKEIMIKVMNTDTQEVIREIPSEKILDMVANFMELAGLYVDEEV